MFIDSLTSMRHQMRPASKSEIQVAYAIKDLGGFIWVPEDPDVLITSEGDKFMIAFIALCGPSNTDTEDSTEEQLDLFDGENNDSADTPTD